MAQRYAHLLNMLVPHLQHCFQILNPTSNKFLVVLLQLDLLEKRADFLTVKLGLRFLLLILFGSLTFVLKSLLSHTLGDILVDLGS